LKTLARTLAAASLLLAAAGFAQTADHPYVQNDIEQLQKACAANPQQCAAAKQRAKTAAATAKADCQANPAACQQIKDKAQTQAQALKTRCAADPAKCEEVKQSALSRQQLRISRRGAQQ
jgi:hypothetical protein